MHSIIFSIIPLLLQRLNAALIKPERVDELISTKSVDQLIAHEPIDEIKIKPVDKLTAFKPVDELAALQAQEYQAAWNSAPKRLILLDGDGVLVPTEKLKEEQQAEAARRAASLLEKLISDQKNEVWMISAQSLDDLMTQYGHLAVEGLSLAGELGAEIRLSDGKYPRFLPSVSEEVKKLSEFLKNQLEGVPFMNRDASILFAKGEGHNDAQVIETMKKSKDQFLFSENESLAKLTHPDINKGNLAKYLLGRHKSNAFVMSFGGMEEDEPMHLALKQSNFNTAVSTYVNTEGHSVADRRLYSPDGVYQFFAELIGHGSK